jgi:hypothetical protein
MSRTRIIVAAVVAILALVAIGSIGRTPDAAPGASPAPSIVGHAATPSSAISESLRPTATATPASTDTPVPTPKVLLTFEGSGIKSSEPFAASGDSVDLAYTFDCSAFGSSGNFAVTFYDQNGLAADSVKELAKSGKDTSIVYIANTAPPYHVEVNSPCTWTITVTGKP